MKHNKAKVVRTIVTYALYSIATCGVALILNGVFPYRYVTVDWLKLFIGAFIIGAVCYTCSWLFPKKTASRKESRDESVKR